MPPIFKALSSITVWVLFIVGWLGVLAGVAGAIGISTGLFLVPSAGATVLTVIVAAFGVGVACFILSAYAIKLRQMLK